MKKLLFFLLLLTSFPFLLKSQTINTMPTKDWGTMRYSGFYESITAESSNLPEKISDYFWGINIAHSGNKSLTHKPYHWGAQMLFSINRGNLAPSMYIRNTNELGNGTWAKVIHDLGDQTIKGKLNAQFINSSNLATNTTKSVLARLPEGNEEGEGTYLGVKSYFTQPTTYIKSFSIEHKYFGQLNNSIDFYRGGSKIGGYIGFTVYNGNQIAKLNNEGLEVGGIIKAREVKIEINAGADHVFAKDYQLKPLKEVESFIKENKHLPELPSEREMQENGLSINEFQIKLLQKIEELTLHMIEQEKKIISIQNENSTLKEENDQIKKYLRITKD